MDVLTATNYTYLATVVIVTLGWFFWKRHAGYTEPFDSTMPTHKHAPQPEQECKPSDQVNQGPESTSEPSTCIPPRTGHVPSFTPPPLETLPPSPSLTERVPQQKVAQLPPVKFVFPAKNHPSKDPRPGRRGRGSATRNKQKWDDRVQAMAERDAKRLLDQAVGGSGPETCSGEERLFFKPLNGRITIRLPPS